MIGHGFNQVIFAFDFIEGEYAVWMDHRRSPFAIRTIAATNN
jgi:hypothetical protein